jgi:hypothetical protein
MFFGQALDIGEPELQAAVEVGEQLGVADVEGLISHGGDGLSHGCFSLLCA